MKLKTIASLIAILPCALIFAQSVEIVENHLFQPGNNGLGPAFGWSTKTDKEIPADNKPTEPVEPTVDLDDPAIIDWMTAEHRGTAGVYDLKATDNFVLTIEGFSGSDNFESGHRFDEAQVFFGYTGGVNFNVPRDGGVAFGTSFNGADDGGATLRILVDVDDRKLYIYHWWNFGYGSFENLNLSLHSANGTELASTSYEFDTSMGEALGLEIAPGASYYSVNFTSIIEVQGTADGDYLAIENIGTNVGWRGTAVATERFDTGSPFEPGYVDHPQLSWMWAYTPDIAYSLTMGYIYGYDSPSSWVYSYNHGWFYVPKTENLVSGAYLYSNTYGGYAYVVDSNGGWFQVQPFGPNDWYNFLIAPAQ